MTDGDTPPSSAATGKRTVPTLEETHRLNTIDAVYSVGVYGATGYAGQVLLSILMKHPNVKIAFVTSESNAEPVEGLELVPSAEAPVASVDVVFLCLPHGASAEIAAQAVAAGVRVIDLSADLRLDSKEVYKQWYKHEHAAPHLLPAPFGLPEVNHHH